MAIPGFSAEASLAATNKGRWLGAASGRKGDGQGIVPQLYEPPEPIMCDIFFTCVDGIRYVVTDCSDGSGDETAIGVCSSFRWWALLPWFIRW